MAWQCPFCDGNANPTKEHVFPEWLLDELGLTRKSTQAIHQTLFGTPKSTRTMTHGGMVLGKVCGQCNNGWMSQLESDVRPILENARTCEPIDTLEGETLATWAFKTAIVLNRWSNYRELAPNSHFRWLKEHGTPIPNVAVDLGYVRDGWEKGIDNACGDLGYHQCMIQPWVLPRNLKELSPQITMQFQEQSYVIVLHVNRCMLRVAYCPISGMSAEPAMNWGESYRLWPVFTHGIMKLDSLRPYESPTHFAMDVQAVPESMLRQSPRS